MANLDVKISDLTEVPDLENGHYAVVQKGDSTNKFNLGEFTTRMFEIIGSLSGKIIVKDEPGDTSVKLGYAPPKESNDYQIATTQWVNEKKYVVQEGNKVLSDQNFTTAYKTDLDQNIYRKTEVYNKTESYSKTEVNEIIRELQSQISGYDEIISELSSKVNEFEAKIANAVEINGGEENEEM